MFNNKVILITGGSSGIGEAVALLFAKNGADIAITYKSNKAGAAIIIKKIKALGRRAIAIEADLVNENEAKNAVMKVIKSFDRIDILINNAGRFVNGDEWNCFSDIWLKSLQQNLISMMNVSKYVIESFLKQKSGVMVNVSSRHGMFGISDGLSYSAAKAGVINITQSYAKLLAPFGRANSVSPWATKAGYWLSASTEELDETIANAPAHRLVEPETVAAKILYLSSDEAKDITGKNFAIDR